VSKATGSFSRPLVSLCVNCQTRNCHHNDQHLHCQHTKKVTTFFSHLVFKTFCNAKSVRSNWVIKTLHLKTILFLLFNSRWMTNSSTYTTLFNICYCICMFLVSKLFFHNKEHSPDICLHCETYSAIIASISLRGTI
jgi:hypothetical protein